MGILDVYATRTPECGVVPIEVGLRPMYDSYYSRVVGCRVRAYINSILYGMLTPDDYAAVLEHEETGRSRSRKCASGSRSGCCSATPRRVIPAVSGAVVVLPVIFA